MKDFTPATVSQNATTVYIDPQSAVPVVDQIIGEFPGLTGSIKKYEFMARNDGLLDPLTAAFEDVRN